jgi:8-oxo-dGTP pyrophosphatase MutT (NUDIX family)
MLTHEPVDIDPRLYALKERFLQSEPSLAAPDLEAERIQAAVSAILRGGEEWEILLIKRAEAEGDPWSGQMALPGGRRDISDRSLLHTAMRETWEETSVPLEDGGIHLGRLAPTVPNTVRLPPIVIHPYVFGVPGSTQARVSSHEVDEVLWVPLSHFKDPSTRGTVEIRYPDKSSRDFPCWRVGERVIWGLTYRILTGLLKII